MGEVLLRDVEYTRVFSGHKPGLWFRNEGEMLKVIGEISTWSGDRRDVAFNIPMYFAGSEAEFDFMTDKAGLETHVMDGISEATAGLLITQYQDAAGEAHSPEVTASFARFAEAQDRLREAFADVVGAIAAVEAAENGQAEEKVKAAPGSSSHLMASVIRNNAIIRAELTNIGLVPNELAGSLEMDANSIGEVA